MDGDRSQPGFFPDEQGPSRAPRRARLDDIAKVVGELRAPLETPDFTQAILARVSQERGFTTVRERRAVAWSKVGLAASLVVAGLGLAVVYQSIPEYTVWAGRPQPLTETVKVVANQTGRSIEAIRELASGSFPLPAGAAETNRAAPNNPDGFTLTSATFAASVPPELPSGGTIRVCSAASGVEAWSRPSRRFDTLARSPGCSVPPPMVSAFAVDSVTDVLSMPGDGRRFAPPFVVVQALPQDQASVRFVSVRGLSSLAGTPGLGGVGTGTGGVGGVGDAGVDGLFPK